MQNQSKAQGKCGHIITLLFPHLLNYNVFFTDQKIKKKDVGTNKPAKDTPGKKTGKKDNTEPSKK